LLVVGVVVDPSRARQVDAAVVRDVEPLVGVGRERVGEGEVRPVRRKVGVQDGEGGKGGVDVEPGAVAVAQGANGGRVGVDGAARVRRGTGVSGNEARIERERDAPSIDLTEARHDDAASPSLLVLAQPPLELDQVHRYEPTFSLRRRIADLDDAPAAEPGERRRLAHARVRVGDKDVDLDAAHAVLGDAPLPLALGVLGARDDPVPPGAHAEEVRRRRAGRERVLGEGGRWEVEKVEEVREGEGLERDRDGLLGPVDLDAGVEARDEQVGELRGGRHAARDEGEAPRAGLAGGEGGRDGREEVRRGRCRGTESVVLSLLTQILGRTFQAESILREVVRQHLERVLNGVLGRGHRKVGQGLHACGEELIDALELLGVCLVVCEGEGRLQLMNSRRSTRRWGRTVRALIRMLGVLGGCSHLQQALAQAEVR